LYRLFCIVRIMASHHGIPTVYIPSTPEDFVKFIEFADSTGPEWRSVHATSDGQTRFWVRKSDGSSVNIVKLVANIVADALTLYDTLHDPDYRKVWDENMVEGYLIEQLDEFNDVGYYSAKSPVALVAGRDFCNERSWQVKDDTQYVIMNHSVIHPQCPEKKGFVRANSITSGYLVRRNFDEFRHVQICTEAYNQARKCDQRLYGMERQSFSWPFSVAGTPQPAHAEVTSVIAPVGTLFMPLEPCGCPFFPFLSERFSWLFCFSPPLPSFLFCFSPPSFLLSVICF